MTRILDVTVTVGTRDTLIFQHFPTKRKLYDAILEKMCMC